MTFWNSWFQVAEQGVGVQTSIIHQKKWNTKISLLGEQIKTRSTDSAIIIRSMPILCHYVWLGWSTHAIVTKQVCGGWKIQFVFLFRKSWQRKKSATFLFGLSFPKVGKQPVLDLWAVTGSQVSWLTCGLCALSKLPYLSTAIDCADLLCDTVVFALHQALHSASYRFVKYCLTRPFSNPVFR